MLLIVCPNLALDRILEVPRFRSSMVLRAAGVTVQPGGKGSNVARVFRQLGGEAALTGFAGRRNGALIREPLHQSGIHADLVEAFDGDSRTCTIIVDPVSDDHPTVINEESPLIDAAAPERLNHRIDEWLPRSNAVLVTGSLASGLAAGFYREVLERAKGRDRFTAIDATGEALAQGVLARPDLLKVNGEEFGRLVGGAAFDMAAAIEYLKRAGDGFPPQVVVTFGAAGAILRTPDGLWRGAATRTLNTNPIGSGDAFAAGYLSGWLASHDSRRAFAMALAAAGSDVGTMRPGEIDRAEVDTLLSTVRIDAV